MRSAVAECYSSVIFQTGSITLNPSEAFMQVASFLEDSQCHTDVINVLVAAIREGLWAEMHRCRVTYGPKQLWDAEFAWRAVQNFTDAVHSLPSGDRQQVAAQFLLEEIMSAPGFFLEAYLNGVASSGELDLSGLLFCGELAFSLKPQDFSSADVDLSIILACDNSFEPTRTRMGLTRVLTESVGMGFRRIVLPPSVFIPELHAPRSSFQPFTTVTSAHFEFVTDPVGIVHMLRLLPNLQQLSASGDAVRLKLEEARAITRLLPSFPRLESVDLSGSKLPAKVYNSFCIGLSECEQLATLHMPDHASQGNIDCHTQHVMDCTLTSLNTLRCLTYRSHAVDEPVVVCVEHCLQWVLQSFFSSLETLNLEVSAVNRDTTVNAGELIETLSSWWSSDVADVPHLRRLRFVLVVPSGVEGGVESVLCRDSTTVEQRMRYRMITDRLDSVEIVVKGTCGRTKVFEIDGA